MSSRIYLNLDQAKILSSANEFTPLFSQSYCATLEIKKKQKKKKSLENYIQNAIWMDR